MPPGALYEALDVERRRGVVGADVEGTAVGIFGADGERAAGNLFHKLRLFLARKKIKDLELRL